MTDLEMQVREWGGERRNHQRTKHRDDRKL